ncbi:right-handed parallel beta-helix repeat-containing protein [Geomonas sp. Red32]|uniref:right-handed parallel beta-helix repeat-containing protein n=1 Tax=Geomonas sp. Red32 TaxID=2912856 RepID=UPI00202D06D7|nr:right-handed parallel beta-helix repeat-containing protein [Geomonas sp. Red32]MCM0080920.1 right-handed parallel beta-helix repeat-containing protein [Geomonas sp. Red32]
MQRVPLKWAPLLVFLLLAGSVAVGQATWSLPPGRSVPWRGNVGVLHDLPLRSAIHTTLYPSGDDDAQAIRSAVAGCPPGKVVMLGPGVFSLGSAVSVTSGVTLRGSGMGITVLRGRRGMAGSFVVGIGDPAFGEERAVPLRGTHFKGGDTVTTASPHGWRAGDLIMIDQLNDPMGDPPVTNVGVGTSSWNGRTGDRSLGQLVSLKEVTSTTATLEIPLYWSFDARLKPSGVRLRGVTSGAGIEDLTVDNGESGSPAQNDSGGTVVMKGVANCWLHRVEVTGSWQSAVRVMAAYRSTIRSCRIHEGIPALPANGPQYGPRRAYGIFINPYASANLFENNEIYHLVSPFLIAGAVSGNVIAYNYLPDPYYSDPNWIQVTIGFHGPHPVMNLIEGNYSVGRIAPDNYWGSSSHNTFFRNRNRLPEGKSGAPWDFDLQHHARYYTLVGNVIGEPGREEVYQLQGVDLAGEKAVFRLGYHSDGDGRREGNDKGVGATLLRHGNWDSVHGAPLWNGTEDRSLPASLYLAGKPAWWGDAPWPPIGPDRVPMYPPDPGVGRGTPWGANGG